MQITFITSKSTILKKYSVNYLKSCETKYVERKLCK